MRTMHASSSMTTTPAVPAMVPAAASWSKSMPTSISSGVSKKLKAVIPGGLSCPLLTPDFIGCEQRTGQTTWDHGFEFFAVAQAATEFGAIDGIAQRHAVGHFVDAGVVYAA